MRSCLDIIIPVYKNAEITRACIRSVLDNLDEIAEQQPRIIVVNDSPDDHEVGQVLERFAIESTNFTLLNNPVNSGFVASVNRGMDSAISSGRDVILINSDTLTFPGTLAEVVRVAALDSMIGFVSPRSNNASICSLPLDFNSPATGPDEARHRWRLLSATMPAVQNSPVAIGFYFFIKHKVLANFGKLRPDFGIGYEEENELAIRANRAGYKSMLANHAFAFHHGSASFSLLDMDLTEHRQKNLEKHCSIHPEFLPLVRRYQKSAHYRAEVLLSGLLPDSDGRLSVVFDLSNLGNSFNGTNEMALNIVKGMASSTDSAFNYTVVCSPEAYTFHGLDDHDNLRRQDLESQQVHTIAIRLGQPFLQQHVDKLERLAPINIYGMLDTIAEDCGHLSITQQLDILWRHVADHANGIFFISEFSRRSFESRFPVTGQGRTHTRLLPTNLESYAKPAFPTAREHILILGNHFPHKSTDRTAELIGQQFPDERIIVIGAKAVDNGTLSYYQAGTLSPEDIDRLFMQAKVIVLPSHVEGFGFGLLHALAARKPIVARRIDATLEILATYKCVSGVHLFDNDHQLAESLGLALNCTRSSVEYGETEAWSDWVRHFTRYCRGLVTQADLFHRLVSRLRSGEFLRAMDDQRSEDRGPASSRSLAELLSYDGEVFVHMAYTSLLNRVPDPVGKANFLWALGTGKSKMDILRMIRFSPEGHAVGRHLEGLQA